MPLEAEKRMHNNPFRRENEIERSSDSSSYGDLDLKIDGNKGGDQGGSRQEVSQPKEEKLAAGW